MADPHLLYIVTAVVVLGLVAWVIVVLARAPALPPVAAKREEAAAPPSPAPAPPPEEAKPAETPANSKPKLDAHLEIQDEKVGEEKPG